MASLSTGIVDPTRVGKYRVVLSDALLGKDPKEIYTGVRYNYKPTLSSSTAPHQARIKPTGSTDPSASYHLSFQDDAGRYAYQGSRGHEDNQYVLIFDPEREVFVLHRVDSMFNMNLARTPTNDDTDSLREAHRQLEAHRPSRTTKPANKSTSSKPTKAKKSAPKDPKSSVVKKVEPPTRVPAKPKKVHHDSEEESSDDDVFTIEDPSGAAPASHRDFSPGFIDKPRRFSEFVEQNHEEVEEDDDGDLGIEVEALNDADGEEEEEEEEDDNFKLPSPIHRQMMGENINGNAGYGSVNVVQSAPAEQESDEDEEEEMEDAREGGAPTAQDDLDLEAVLMAELEGESDVSEEE
ncbi:hypothetical protein GQX73_g2651 [Xylaria multiplex]|uniref:Transcription elongation factor Eaf N-terminal domain-containing protein n=1 Tax=Xylaria multiplex TaxID=323545 RepID=A0A7C8MXZ4_9PEZI|nr:hypothetical protein GQX73_g2651 [Xylaria multiplex]